MFYVKIRKKTFLYYDNGYFTSRNLVPICRAGKANKQKCFCQQNYRRDKILSSDTYLAIAQLWFYTTNIVVQRHLSTTYTIGK